MTDRAIDHINEQSKFLVRDVEDREISEMVALTLNSYREYEANVSHEFWQAYKENISTAITTAEDSIRIAAFVERQMVGSVLLCSRNMIDQLPEIRLLAVDPGHRKYGIGKILMNECEGRALNAGAASVILHTTKIMSVARSMYERSGYVRADEYDFWPTPDFLVMGYRKRLDALPRG